MIYADRKQLMERMEREIKGSGRGRRFNAATYWIAWEGRIKEFQLTEEEQRYLHAKYPPPPRPQEPTGPGAPWHGTPMGRL